MGSRLELQTLLEDILGSRNVYFQPLASVKMQYDAIRYNLSKYDVRRANDRLYLKTKQYEGVVITYDPDSDIPDRMLETLQMCDFGKPYTADNLNHFPFTLYF